MQQRGSSESHYMNFGEALDRLKKKYPDGDWISCDPDWEIGKHVLDLVSG